ncbi:uncharacterized protein [Amphiura filiformis]|uniref:uncharacterized protein n=1 Tax=Amphiura filiformis TaxID=82378 RepID=UPI003B2125B4
MQTPSPVLHEQNPMQPMPQYPLQPGYGGPPPSAHHPTGPPPPIQHPWQGPGPGPPPSYPPPPIHSGPPPQHPPYPPYMPPPNFPRGPPPPLPPPQRPPGEAPWQHKPSEQPPHQIPPPPPQQQQPREGHNYDYQQQRNPDEWPKHLPMPTHGGAPPPDRRPPPINPSHNQPPPHIWGGDGRPLPDQDHIARQQDMQRYGDTSPLEDRFQTSAGKSGHDFQQPTSSRPMGTQQQVPPHPGQYPQHPPPPFNIPPPQPSQDKTPSKYPQQQEMSSGDLDTPSLLELLVKMQSQPPPQNPNFPNDVGGSSMIPDRSIQSEALKTLAIGLGLQSPDKTFPPPPDYSQYEALLKSIQSSSQDTNPNPQSFAGLAKNQPPTSSSLHFGSDFELKRMQQQQQQQQQQQSPFKTSLEQNPSSSSQPRLPPGLSGLEDVQGRRMNSSPFENRSTSLFSHPQQQKPAEPMQGTAAEWRQTDQLRRGMTGGGSHLFPTREEHQDRRGGGGGAGGELPSWLDKSAFGSVAGERRTRQQETPTLLMPENDSFGLSPSPTKGMGSGSMGSGSMGSFLGQDRGDGLGSRMHGRSKRSTYGNIAENRSSSLFPSAEKRKSSLEDVSFNSPAGGPGSGGASGSYSLFSYSSPWSGSKEGLNLSSSPFSSSPSSPRSQSPSIQYSSHHQQSGGGNLLGWSPAERSTGPSWSRGASTVKFAYQWFAARKSSVHLVESNEQQRSISIGAASEEPASTRPRHVKGSKPSQILQCRR